jgi:hypothetical protein
MGWGESTSSRSRHIGTGGFQAPPTNDLPSAPKASADTAVANAKKFMADNKLGTSMREALFMHPKKEAREYVSTLSRNERRALEDAAAREA